MNGRTLAVVALALLTAVGCSSARRRNDAYQELLNAEKRYLEDQLYDLHYESGVLQDKYKSTLRENASLRRALQQRSQGEAASDGLPGRDRNGPPDINGVAPPQIDLGEPSLNGRPITPPGDLIPEGSSLSPPDGDRDAAAPAGDFPISHEELIDPRITHIHLNPLLTGGADFDEKPGDDGVSVVIEPRNAGGKYVPLAGPISLVLLDGARQGESARVARWDFTVNETRELMTNSLFGKGIHLRMPWPQEPPDNSRLTLFVRYTTPEGTKLEASREIFIELPGQTSRPWRPMAPGSDAVEEIDPSELEIEIHPGAAIPRRTIASNPSPAKSLSGAGSPPAGPTVSDDDARPRWRPFR
jgi:hypothetical protein